MASAELYPLKFQPIYKEKLWGGQKIRTVLNKDFGPLANCGESWEISGVKGNVSVVTNGALAGKNLVELIDEYRETLVGKKVFTAYGTEFPLLIKFIDANDDLSIQVHPDDELARRRHNSLGKTEMWYIFQADPGAKLITGFSKKVDKAGYLRHLESKKLNEILNSESVEPDDVFFLPAGRVHTIGKGLLLAEIQQTSDVTYRIYDFDRKDDQGRLRELHTEEALDALDFEVHDDYKTHYNKEKNEAVNLVTCPYFSTSRLHLDRPLKRDFTGHDSFVVYVCMEGEAKIITPVGTETLHYGESLLMPSAITAWTIEPTSECKMLEAYVP